MNVRWHTHATGRTAECVPIRSARNPASRTAAICGEHQSRTRSRRPSYEFLKIARAVEEEIAETGMELDKFLALRPVEKRTRLIERMKKWKFATDEIPEERSFRDYFKRLKSDHDRKVGTLQEA